MTTTNPKTPSASSRSSRTRVVAPDVVQVATQADRPGSSPATRKTPKTTKTRGRGRPSQVSDKRAILNVRVPVALRVKLERRATDLDVSLSDVVALVLERGLSR